MSHIMFHKLITVSRTLNPHAPLIFSERSASSLPKCICHIERACESQFTVHVSIDSSISGQIFCGCFMKEINLNINANWIKCIYRPNTILPHILHAFYVPFLLDFSHSHRSASESLYPRRAARLARDVHHRIRAPRNISFPSNFHGLERRLLRNDSLFFRVRRAVVCGVCLWLCVCVYVCGGIEQSVCVFLLLFVRTVVIT